MENSFLLTPRLSCLSGETTRQTEAPRVFVLKICFFIWEQTDAASLPARHLLGRVISEAFSLRAAVSADGLALPMHVYLPLIKMLPSLPFGPRAQQGGAVAWGTDPGWQAAWGRSPY